MSLVIWIFIYSLLLLALRGSVGKLTESRLVKIVFFPGFLATVFVRRLTCFLSRTPVKEVNLPWRPGPPIAYGRPAVAFYGPLIFALLPASAGAGLLLAIAKTLEFPLWFDVQLPSIEPDMKDLSVLLQTSGEILTAAARTVSAVDARDPRLWLFVYSAAALHLFLAPQLQEWRPLAVLLGVAGGLMAACDWLGLQAGFLSRGWYIRTFYGRRVWDGLSLLVATALLGLVVAGLAVGTAALARAARGRERRGK